MTSGQEPDVLVIGGGTAGFGAAVAAGRQGLSVMMLEAGTKTGGVMAFCPGMPWGGGYPLGESIGGLFAELTDRLVSLRPAAAERRPCTLENFGDEVVYDPDAAQIEMFAMLGEAGVDVRLNATALEPVMSGNQVAAIEWFDRHGAHVCKPKMVIDCSGDGDISAKAGIPFETGDGKGNMMGVTLSFMMIDADWDRVFAEKDPYFSRYAEEGVAAGRLHPDLAKLYLMKGFHKNTVFCNSVHIRGVDGTDPVSISKATQEGRKRCRALAEFLSETIPGFENAWMSNLGPTVGVRETRKLHGMVRLTADDVRSARKFDDGIVACANPVDDVMRGDGAMTHEAAVEDGAYYTLPFRALVPEHVTNLLFAGRVVSADPVAFASIRGMPQCMAMGQAAGTAAALALRSGCPVQRIDAGALVSELTAQGMSRLGSGDKMRDRQSGT